MRTENQRYCIIGGLHISSRKNSNAIKIVLRWNSFKPAHAYKIRPCIFENPLMSSCYLGYVVITLTIVRIVSCGVRLKIIRKPKQFVTIGLFQCRFPTQNYFFSVRSFEPIHFELCHFIIRNFWYYIYCVVHIKILTRTIGCISVPGVSSGAFKSSLYNSLILSFFVSGEWSQIINYAN